MFKAILILSLLALSSFALYSADLQEHQLLWSTWKNKFEKSYGAAEDTARFAIFVENYKKIVSHNADKTNTFTLALNGFADLTGEEFKNLYTGCAFVEGSQRVVDANTAIPTEGFSYPGAVDWRNNGVVTGVKDQGQCGSCWTFSTTGAIESFYALRTGQLQSFSEQELVDCASSAGSGCAGGWPYKAIAYAAYYGLETEGEYPYTAQDGSCAYNAGAAIRANSGYNFVQAQSVDALKTALSGQPVSIVIEADQQVFQFYSSGVITSGCGNSCDHAVLAVGYESYAGVDSFIVKNSWGASWGQAGYVYISTDGSQNAGTGVCGILTQPVVPY